MRERKWYFYLLILFIIFLMFKAVDNLGYLLELFRGFLGLISPVIIAFGIAYILKPLIVYLETRFRMKRYMSILIVYLAFLGLVIFSLTFFTPRILRSVENFIVNIPTYLSNMERWVDTELMEHEYVTKYELQPYVMEYKKIAIDHIKDLSGSLNEAVSNVALGLRNFAMGLVKFSLGFIISIYMLIDKEKFAATGKRILYAFMSDRNAEATINFLKESDQTFSRYLVGKLLDSSIIGMICYGGLLLLNAPYPLLLSLIVGVTNMIPYFGPFIGMIPATVITLFISPIQALWVFLFILALQQFDGLYLGPKILGDKVGISPFWVILAIIVGGGTFGVLGMFLAVPFFAVLKMGFEMLLNHQMAKKKRIL
ncbi:AI-2E family transporter [Rubeoparvulum massiliense]|uniref:AI-2E family transporter n=1 Tax=Rubeoparvulum massiliense TaxID=1631346 RepID=UPI00065E5FE3|nr:AI-2E family transporter [Rubeoparvulum massiliense]